MASFEELQQRAANKGARVARVPNIYVPNAFQYRLEDGYGHASYADSLRELESYISRLDARLPSSHQPSAKDMPKDMSSQYRKGNYWGDKPVEVHRMIITENGVFRERVPEKRVNEFMMQSPKNSSYSLPPKIPRHKIFE